MNPEKVRYPSLILLGSSMSVFRDAEYNARVAACGTFEEAVRVDEACARAEAAAARHEAHDEARRADRAVRFVASAAAPLVAGESARCNSGSNFGGCNLENCRAHFNWWCGPCESQFCGHHTCSCRSSRTYGPAEPPPAVAVSAGCSPVVVSPDGGPPVLSAPAGGWASAGWPRNMPRSCLDWHAALVAWNSAVFQRHCQPPQPQLRRRRQHRQLPHAADRPAAAAVNAAAADNGAVGLPPRQRNPKRGPPANLLYCVCESCASKHGRRQRCSCVVAIAVVDLAGDSDECE